MELSELTAQARKATEELLEAAHLETGDVFVVGCSSSEIRGGRIGHDSSMEVAAAVLARGAAPAAGAGRLPGRPVLRASEPLDRH